MEPPHKPKHQHQANQAPMCNFHCSLPRPLLLLPVLPLVLLQPSLLAVMRLPPLLVVLLLPPLQVVLLRLLLRGMSLPRVVSRVPGQAQVRGEGRWGQLPWVRAWVRWPLVLSWPRQDSARGQTAAAAAQEAERRGRLQG